MNHTIYRDTLLAHYPRLTVKRLRDLCVYADTWEHIRTIPDTLLKEKKWTQQEIHHFRSWYTESRPDHVMDTLEKEHIHVVCIDATTYPASLQTIFDPPPALFVQGTLPAHMPHVAVVGSRRPTSYGMYATESIANGLCASNVVIVSGLALGIDGLAHTCAVDHKKPTVAVLGSGLDRTNFAPKQHRTLAERIIAEGGAIVSECPPGTAATRFTFPKRNRIIAGLSLGTVVIEARIGSGSLITASAALENAREIFAVPHQISSKAGEGTNQLIKQGAHTVTSHEDILSVLHLLVPATSAPIEPQYLNEKEQELLRAFSDGHTSIDDLIEKTGLPPGQTLGLVTGLELRGIIKDMGGRMYIRVY